MTDATLNDTADSLDLQAAALEQQAAHLRAQAEHLRATRQPAATAAELLAVEDAALALGVSRSTVYRLIRDGQFRSVQLGTRRLIPRTAIAEVTERAAS